MTPQGPRLVGHGARLRELARRRPDLRAITFAAVDRSERTLTWAQLEQSAIRAAHLLRDRGAGADSLVVIVLPNEPAHTVAAYAAWKLGATVLPYNPLAPRPERDRVLELAAGYRPLVTIGDWTDGVPPGLSSAELLAARDPAPGSPPLPPDPVAMPGHIIASGGTTGSPKITITQNPGAIPIRDGHLAISPPPLGLREGLVHLITTPLYHTSGFTWTHLELMTGNHVILAERFDPGLWLHAVERHHVNHAILVPSIMQRLLERPDIDDRDLSSIEILAHGGSICPDWVKRRWLNLLPPRSVIEAFGGTEPIGGTIIDGEEWLRRPGSVGRPTTCDLQILDEHGCELPPGTVGEIFMRPHGAHAPAFRYAGSEYHGVAPGGFVSVGDFGWVDEDGYLYIADRRVDMIVSGGANIYPAEIESCLSEHVDVADVAVIGLQDESWGRRVHAVVLPRDPTRPPAVRELEMHCRQRLAPYKVPKSFEFVSSLPRNEVGKLARRLLLREREGGQVA